MLHYQQLLSHRLTTILVTLPISLIDIIISYSRYHPRRPVRHGVLLVVNDMDVMTLHRYPLFGMNRVSLSRLHTDVGLADNDGSADMATMMHGLTRVGSNDTMQLHWKHKEKPKMWCIYRPMAPLPSSLSSKSLIERYRDRVRAADDYANDVVFLIAFDAYLFRCRISTGSWLPSVPLDYITLGKQPHRGINWYECTPDWHVLKMAHLHFIDDRLVVSDDNHTYQTSVAATAVFPSSTSLNSFDSQKRRKEDRWPLLVCPIAPHFYVSYRCVVHHRLFVFSTLPMHPSAVTSSSAMAACYDHRTGAWYITEKWPMSVNMAALSPASPSSLPLVLVPLVFDEHIYTIDDDNKSSSFIPPSTSGIDDDDRKHYGSNNSHLLDGDDSGVLVWDRIHTCLWYYHIAHNRWHELSWQLPSRITVHHIIAVTGAPLISSSGTEVTATERDSTSVIPVIEDGNDNRIAIIIIGTSINFLHKSHSCAYPCLHFDK